MTEALEVETWLVRWQLRLVRARTTWETAMMMQVMMIGEAEREREGCSRTARFTRRMYAIVAFTSRTCTHARGDEYHYICTERVTQRRFSAFWRSKKSRMACSSTALPASWHGLSTCSKRASRRRP